MEGTYDVPVPPGLCVVNTFIELQRSSGRDGTCTDSERSSNHPLSRYTYLQTKRQSQSARTATSPLSERKMVVEQILNEIPEKLDINDCDEHVCCALIDEMPNHKPRFLVAYWVEVRQNCYAPQIDHEKIHQLSNAVERVAEKQKNIYVTLTKWRCRIALSMQSVQLVLQCMGLFCSAFPQQHQ